MTRTKTYLLNVASDGLEGRIEQKRTVAAEMMDQSRKHLVSLFSELETVSS
jgi:hypothetical protein